MRKLTLAVGAVALLTVMGLLLLLPQTNSVNAAAITQQATQEMTRLVDGVDGGQILHIRKESRRQVDPSRQPGPWRQPAYLESEIWMALDADGCLTTYSSVSRDSDGEVVSHSKIENGQNVLTWAATGDQITYPVTCAAGGEVSSWLNSLWSYTANDPSYTNIGSGRINGKETGIFEKEVSTSVTAGEQFSQGQQQAVTDSLAGLAPSVVYRLEFPADKPLLYKSSTYDKDAGGVRTLKEEHHILEYNLLPANTQIGPFDNN